MGKIEYFENDKPKWLEYFPRHSEGSEPEQNPQTLAALFTGRVGRIRSGGKERLSEEGKVAFTDYLEEKRKAGHL